MEIADKDGTAYGTISRKRLNSTGSDTWIVGHSNEPFRVKLTVPALVLEVQPGMRLQAELYVDGNRMRDTRGYAAIRKGWG